MARRRGRPQSGRRRQGRGRAVCWRYSALVAAAVAAGCGATPPWTIRLKVDSTRARFSRNCPLLWLSSNEPITRLKEFQLSLGNLTQRAARGALLPHLIELGKSADRLERIDPLGDVVPRRAGDVLSHRENSSHRQNGRLHRVSDTLRVFGDDITSLRRRPRRCLLLLLRRRELAFGT